MIVRETITLDGDCHIMSVSDESCAGERTDAQVCVDGGVAGSARQVLVLAVGDVLVCAGVPILLGQSKVDDVDQVALLAQTHQEVVWLHISVDEVLGVDVLDAAYLEITW